MSDSDANPTPRRSRTRPAMLQDAQSAPTPATTRRRTLRGDPFSVEPLSRPRRRLSTPTETVKPARSRKRGRDDQDSPKAASEQAGASSGQKSKDESSQAVASEPSAKGRRSRTKSVKNTTTGTSESAPEAKTDTRTDAQGEEGGSRKRTRTRAKKPVAALPEAKRTPALPEPKPTLALDEPRKDAKADRGGDQADEAVEAPAKATRRRTRTKDATGGTATRGSKRQRTGASPDDTPSGVDAVHEADHEDESVEAQDGKRKRRPRRRKRKTGVEGNTGSARSTSKSSRRQGAVLPAEVRNAIEVAPPRKMLVTRKDRTTQIAVLEDRTLVEHYVTQSHEQSFVGNIYKGRVQNVLPGMEAAFVDIGKGRNGVLYAGEVLYDEDDLDGQPARIEGQLKPGQTVIVQVTKDPMGTKGARLTQHLSLAGRFCVLSPFDSMLGISRKLPEGERERLRKILKGVRPEGYGLIVRTAAEGCSPDQLIADVERLVNRWQRVAEKIDKAKALDTVYAEPDLVLRVIRDVFGSEHTDLIVDDEELAERIRDYLGETSPEDVSKVQVYQSEGADGEPRNLFADWQISAQVRRALETKVWLKSGGYLIIEKTEAMWVIDVNTGRFVGKDNLEETILKNNIEAAVEIARQLRLRDMGGIIVIDFVDMLVPAHRDEVLKRFKAELARDKTKTRVMDISKLGLVQMTRKNVSKGLMEVFTEPTDDVIPGRRLIKNLLDD